MENNTIKYMGNRIIPTGRPIGTGVPTPNSINKNQGSGSFSDVLNSKILDAKSIKFSKHAEERLRSRNIQLDSTQMQQLQDAIGKAEAKGVRQSLILMDKVAMVVSIPNRTVITAVNNQELKENVFTNIDGAIIV